MMGGTRIWSGSTDDHSRPERKRHPVMASAGSVMRRKGEHRQSRRARAAENLHYWYQATPAGIQDAWSEATSRVVIPESALERFRTEHPEVSAKGTHRVVEALLQWVRSKAVA